MRYARTSNRSETARTNQDVFNVPGGLTGGATPVPIPNTEVKPSKADDTAAARQWESRTLPGYKKKPAGESQQAFLFCAWCRVLKKVDGVDHRHQKIRYRVGGMSNLGVDLFLIPSPRPKKILPAFLFLIGFLHAPNVGSVSCMHAAPSNGASTAKRSLSETVEEFSRISR
jgi:hypothetical protein